MNREEKKEEEKKKKKKKKNDVTLGSDLIDKSSATPVVNPVTTSMPSASGAGHACDGNVCTFDPDAHFGGGSTSSGFEQPQDVDMGSSTSGNDYSSSHVRNVYTSSKIENCIGELCTKITEEKDCSMNEFGMCEEVADNLEVLLTNVYQKGKDVANSQFDNVRVSLGKSTVRILGETFVNFRKYKNFKDPIIHLVAFSFLSLILQFVIKMTYELTIEVLAQFCCGDAIYDMVPGLDKLVMVMAFTSSLRNGKNFFFGTVIGLKEILKILLNVHMTRFFGTCCPEKMLGYHDYIAIFLTAIFVNVLDKIVEMGFQKMCIRKEGKTENDAKNN